jgi:hypothetical protein
MLVTYGRSQEVEGVADAGMQFIGSLKSLKASLLPRGTSSSFVSQRSRIETESQEVRDTREGIESSAI